MVVPRSLMTGLAINGTLGFAMMVATLYSIKDLALALAENPQYPFMSIFRHAVGSTAGATVMSVIILVMCFSATTGCLASASRISWAFARDRGLPGWNYLRIVHPRTSIPQNAVLVTVVISIVLSLVNIGHTAAFNGVISISIAGLFGSYLIASALLLYRRVTGAIHTRDDNDDILTNTIGGKLTWGPWRLRGAFGIANNAFSCAYLTYTFFFSFWPPSREVTPETFNWAVLVFTVVVVFSVVYYMTWARKTYTGPVIELDQ